MEQLALAETAAAEQIEAARQEAWGKGTADANEKLLAVSDLPCNVRREGGQSLVIGGSSLVILEGKACNPL